MKLTLTSRQINTLADTLRAHQDSTGDTEVTLKFCPKGDHGPGLYAWLTGRADAGVVPLFDVAQTGCATAPATLERELAIDVARADLECWAAQIPQPERQMPRYDVNDLDANRAAWMDQDDMRRCIKRAVRYLDLIGGLERPVPGRPNIVAISSKLRQEIDARIAADCAAVEGGA